MASLPATRPIIGTQEDDVITGSKHSDVMSGRNGDDQMSGQNGNDEVWGGRGDDILYGNNGNDKLYGAGGPTLVNFSAITITDDYPVSVTFEGETAGYRNSFGYYKSDPQDGTIIDPDIIWENASLQGSGGSLIQGVSTETLDVSAGDQIGFFIVSNGYSYNNYAALGEGSLAFVNADDSPATLDSTDPKLVFTATDGTKTEILYHTYHTAAYGDRLALNPDGILHTTGVLKTDKGTITLGFEDLYNGGDRDFDDSVFTVNIGSANATVLNAHYRDATGLNDPDPQEGETPAVPDFSDNDHLYGGTGRDELFGFRGNDELHGGNGNDELHGGLGNDILKGDAGEDDLFGNSGDDHLYGGGQNDILNGSSGDDYLDGGHGNDELAGGSGNDTLLGDMGNDVLSGTGGDDYLDGGSGQDILTGGSGNDSLFGGSDADTLDGNSGDDVLTGGSGNDVLSGGSGADSVLGGNGNDDLNGNSGDDLLDGGSGNDIINGGSGIDTVDYSNWDTKIIANLLTGLAKGNGTDELISIENVLGTDYNDNIVGNRKDNQLYGNEGNDRLVGYTGDDSLYGGAGEDYLNGSSGADLLFGDGADDLLRGGKGSDELTGGAGNDVLYGAELGRQDQAVDYFVFAAGDGQDVIIDFDAGTDLIKFDGSYSASEYESCLLDSDQGALFDFSLLDATFDDSILFQNVGLANLQNEDWFLIA
ncbi:MAG: DUF4114 domain-containing protein [Cohaesibacter sp.]|nr:DUF4114 domain-containing protein [Cohaesibacter sp.]